MTLGELITLIATVVLMTVAIIWTVAIAGLTLLGFTILFVLAGIWVGGKMIWDYIKS